MILVTNHNVAASMIVVTTEYARRTNVIATISGKVMNVTLRWNLKLLSL